MKVRFNELVLLKKKKLNWIRILLRKREQTEKNRKDRETVEFEKKGKENSTTTLTKKIYFEILIILN